MNKKQLGKIKIKHFIILSKTWHCKKFVNYFIDTYMYQLSRTFELRTVHIQCKAEFTMPRKVLCMTCLESWARSLKVELR